MKGGIKWRKQDVKKLTTYVQKFNRSITMLERKNPEMSDAGLLPKRLDIKEVKASIGTRNDFNRTLSRIDRWFKPKAREVVEHKSGIRRTRWELQEARYAQQSMNAKVKAMQKKYGLSDKAAKQIGLAPVDVDKKLEQFASRAREKSRTNYSDMSNEIQGYLNFLNSLITMSGDSYFDRKNQQYYDNYIASIYNHLSQEHADAIADMVKGYGVSGFQLYVANLYDDTLGIDFVYGPEDEESKFNAIMEYFPEVMQELTGDYY